MFETGQLIRCQERKAAILQQSATNRCKLVVEGRNLSPVVAWVDLGVGVGRKALTGCSVMAPVLSLWRGQKQAAAGVAQKVAGAVSLARALTALWKILVG